MRQASNGGRGRRLRGIKGAMRSGAGRRPQRPRARLTPDRHSRAPGELFEAIAGFPAPALRRPLQITRSRAWPRSLRQPCANDPGSITHGDPCGVARASETTSSRHTRVGGDVGPPRAEGRKRSGRGDGRRAGEAGDTDPSGRRPAGPGRVATATSGAHPPPLSTSPHAPAPRRASARAGRASRARPRRRWRAARPARRAPSPSGRTRTGASPDRR